MLLGAAASSALVALPGGAQAQGSSGAATALRQILGQNLPQDLAGLLPGGGLDVANIVTSLLGLEGEAQKIRLPKSKLSLQDTALPTSLDDLYQAALPRLVALIDRSAIKNPGFADKAGGLLAQLHATQHRPSDWLSRNQGRMSFDPGGDEPLVPSGQQINAADLALDLPEIAPPDEGAARVTVKRSFKFADLAEEYAATFAAAAPRLENQQSTQWHLTMLRQNRERYEAVGKRTGVPWYFIGATHGLEASFNFRGHLHNGDFPLTARTRQVPAGRPLRWGPPSDWESSAADALSMMGFTGASDWTLPRTLYRLEAYNGFGYRRIGRATPYLWSFSSVYSRGKFVADGRFNPQARSQQCGAAVMLKLLAESGDITLAG